MYSSRLVRPFIPFLIFLGIQAALSALDLPVNRIPDDSSLRISLADAWFTEAPSVVLNRRRQIRELPGGGRVEVRTEAVGEEFMVILAREQNGAFTGWAQGSWVLTRRRDDGRSLRIRVFPQSDFNTYVQFRPFSADKCVMDVVVYNSYIVDSLPLALPFERLYVLPLEEVLGLAKDKFPRRYFEPQLGAYRDIRTFINELREHIPELSFRDDGALDDQGQYVFINDLKAQDGEAGLNCSGFAKWVVDGLLRPLTGERLSIAPLKAPFGKRGSSFTEPYEALRDPFFGLDWTRNLASAAGRALLDPAFGELPEIEVQDAPFSSVIRREKQGSVVRTYPGYLPDAGFGIDGLQPLLYTLAINEPGRIYLASVSAEMDPAPRMRQHFHVAVLIPYFNEYGNFRVAVFESAEETSFNNFKTRYPSYYSVNLVRIPVESAFDP
ncbi:conserved hypothetical protein [Treponema primitia ZAS-2]|uniref:Uncharacterized protein n=1 Tax=Treponema primitia (strain ATCC BAA-887 / DSM 12427 / ZAS-2) TaxID=545694 RepID=F5YHP7_TREPZ|nr:hypothetical protein [Treponema primitia]AEF84378.1 conserved hypothetical protein [Treponema primitia ZAS-2]